MIFYLLFAVNMHDFAVIPNYEAALEVVPIEQKTVVAVIQAFHAREVRGSKYDLKEALTGIFEKVCSQDEFVNFKQHCDSLLMKFTNRQDSKNIIVSDNMPADYKICLLKLKAALFDDVCFSKR